MKTKVAFVMWLVAVMFAGAKRRQCGMTIRRTLQHLAVLAGLIILFFASAHFAGQAQAFCHSATDDRGRNTRISCYRYTECGNLEFDYCRIDSCRELPCWNGYTSFCIDRLYCYSRRYTGCRNLSCA